MDPRSDQLIEVLVTRYDHGLQPGFPRLDRQGADDVIGFVAVQLDDRVVETGHDVSDASEARRQVIGHLLAGCLVVRILFVTEGVTGVENDGEIVRLELLANIQQESREAEGG
jgi:hypothetical protein